MIKDIEKHEYLISIENGNLENFIIVDFIKN